MALKRNFTSNSVDCKKQKVCNSLEENFIDYLSVPSLESMSIVAITSVLYKQSDIIDSIRKHSITYDTPGRNCRGTFHDRSTIEIENKILCNLDHLPLPNELKVKVSNTVKPILLQVLSWIDSERKDLDYIDSICWNNVGTIDKIKTLEKLIDRNAGQNVESNFKLACQYCLEEIIPKLWNELQDDTKNHYLSSKNIYKSYDNHLIVYWALNICSDLSELFEKIRSYDNKHLYSFNDSINKNMFQLALYTNNIWAVKYFWNKLTYAEICSNLSLWVKDVIQTKGSWFNDYQTICVQADILYFLLSKMESETERRKIFQDNSDVILKSLISDWPWQRFLLPTMISLWEYVDIKLYADILNYISRSISVKNTAGHLFAEVWSDTPVDLKKQFINEKRYHDILHNLFCNLLVVEKVGTVKALLKWVRGEEQKKVLFDLVTKTCFFPVCLDKLCLFDDICVDLLSQSDIKCIKETIARYHGNDLCSKWIRSDEWDKVNAFLHWAFDFTDQIERFKEERLEKVEITYSLIFHDGNYEFANKFLSWCYASEEDIHKFKIGFVVSKPSIVGIGCNDWQLFERFVDWCYNSEEDIQNFKSYISQYYVTAMHDCIFSCYSYSFEFLDNLMKWCCNSKEELKELKEAVALSSAWMEILQRFVSNYKLYDSEWDNWELIMKLVKLVSPLKDDVIIEMKSSIASDIDFDDFRGNFSFFKVHETCFRVEKEHLFRLLDDNTYDMRRDSDSEPDDHNENDSE